MRVWWCVAAAVATAERDVALQEVAVRRAQHEALSNLLSQRSTVIDQQAAIIQSLRRQLATAQAQLHAAGSGDATTASAAATATTPPLAAAAAAAESPLSTPGSVYSHATAVSTAAAVAASAASSAAATAAAVAIEADAQAESASLAAAVSTPVTPCGPVAAPPLPTPRSRATGSSSSLDAGAPGAQAVGGGPRPTRVRPRASPPSYGGNPGDAVPAGTDTAGATTCHVEASPAPGQSQRHSLHTAVSPSGDRPDLDYCPQPPASGSGSGISASASALTTPHSEGRDSHDTPTDIVVAGGGGGGGGSNVVPTAAPPLSVSGPNPLPALNRTASGRTVGAGATATVMASTTTTAAANSSRQAGPGLIGSVAAAAAPAAPPSFASPHPFVKPSPQSMYVA